MFTSKSWFTVAPLFLGIMLPQSGCKKASTTPKANARKANTPTTRSKPAPRKPVAKNVVLFFGDSLTAGYQLAKSQAFPDRIGKAWKKEKRGWKTRGAGYSGGTTAGALSQLDWNLTPDIHSVFLAIGANDGQRGKKIKDIQNNIEELIKRIQKKGIRVILAGIMIPPNLGPKYTKAFKEIYPTVAKKYKLKLMPFLLKDVAGRRELNLADGVHPNAKGHEIITNNILVFFKKEKLFASAPPAPR